MTDTTESAVVSFDGSPDDLLAAVRKRWPFAYFEIAIGREVCVRLHTGGGRVLMAPPVHVREGMDPLALAACAMSEAAHRAGVGRGGRVMGDENRGDVGFPSEGSKTPPRGSQGPRRAGSEATVNRCTWCRATREHWQSSRRWVCRTCGALCGVTVRSEDEER